MAFDFFGELIQGIANQLGGSTRFGSHLSQLSQFFIFLTWCAGLLASALISVWLLPVLTTTGTLRLLGYAADLVVATTLAYLVGRFLYAIEGLDYQRLRGRKDTPDV